MSNIIISQSDVKAWRICKRQGVKSATTKRSEVAGPARVGQGFHACMQAYGNHLLDTKQESDVEFADATVIRACAQLSPEDAANLRSFAVDAVLEFPWAMILDAVEVHFEERLFVTLEDTPRAIDAAAVNTALQTSHVFAGTPDLWWVDASGLVHMVDHKTGHMVHHVSAPEHSFQHRTYIAAILAATDKSRRAVPHTYHARKKWLETPMDDPDSPPKTLGWEDVVVEWTAVNMAAAHLANAGDHPAETYGAHCSLCSHQVGCHSYAAHVFGVMECTTPEDALDELVNLKQRIKVCETVVKRACNSGALVSGTHQAKMKDVDVGGFKVQATEDLEQMLPRTDFLATVGLTKGRLEKTFKKHKMADAVDGFVEKYRVKRVNSKLSVSQVGQRGDEDEDEE